MCNREQDLSNFIMKKDYKNAIILSMELDQPYRLMKLFSEVLYQKKDPDSILGLEAVDDVIFNLSNDQVIFFFFFFLIYINIQYYY